MKILVVDDEQLARARVIRMLTTLGYKDILEATNADEAIEIVRENELDETKVANFSSGSVRYGALYPDFVYCPVFSCRGSVIRVLELPP